MSDEGQMAPFSRSDSKTSADGHSISMKSLKLNTHFMLPTTVNTTPLKPSDQYMDHLL